VNFSQCCRLNACLDAIPIPIPIPFRPSRRLQSQFVVNIMLHFSFRAGCRCCWACCYRVMMLLLLLVYYRWHCQCKHLHFTPHPAPFWDCIQGFICAMVFAFLLSYTPPIQDLIPRSWCWSCCTRPVVPVVIAMFLTNSQGNAHGCLFIVPCMRFTFIFNLCRQFASVQLSSVRFGLVWFCPGAVFLGQAVVWDIFGADVGVVFGPDIFCCGCRSSILSGPRPQDQLTATVDWFSFWSIVCSFRACTLQ